MKIILMGIISLFLLFGCGSQTRNPGTIAEQDPESILASEPTPAPTPIPTPAPPATPAPTPPPLAPPEIQGPYEVWLPGRSFSPYTLTVPAGTTVTWTSKDFEWHTVTSDIGLFDATLEYSESVKYTFNEPGTYNYYCVPHPSMTGIIIVENIAN